MTCYVSTRLLDCTTTIPNERTRRRRFGDANSAMPIRRGQLGAGTTRRGQFGAGHFDAIGALIRQLTEKEKD